MVRQLVALAGTGLARSDVGRFVDEQGWPERDEIFETASGHQLVPAVPLEYWEDQRPSLHLPFCYFDPGEDTQYGLLGDDFSAPGDADGWEILGTTEQSPFFAAWQHGCTAVTAELGQPKAALTLAAEPEDWHFAVWQAGPTALVVAQSEEFSSYGELAMAAVWVIRHEAETPLPVAGDEFYGWLLGEG